MTTVELVTCEEGDAQCVALLGLVRDDPALMAELWADAESRMPAEPGKRWTIAVVQDHERRVAAAWAGAVVIDEDGVDTLKCVDSCEVRAYRGRGLYELVHAEQRRAIVEPWPGPAVTYVFDGPRRLYEAAGWTVTGEGDSDDGHHWFRLCRPARVS